MKPPQNRNQGSLGLSRKGATWRTKAPVVKPRQILVPIDFSDCSYEALRYALAFAAHFRAGVILLHVIEVYPIDYVLGLESTIEANGWLAEQAQSRLVQSAKRCAGADHVQVSAIVRFGRPFREITNAAKERQVDLIITGTHGFTGLRHLQLGSTAEKVVRYASCPVIVVREKEKELVAAGEHGNETVELACL
jgi:nucleotide-binding universal stress UspA family protein